MEKHRNKNAMHPIVPKNVIPVIEAIRNRGGRPFVVGGAVRDTLLGRSVTTKDLDFEIYHLTLDSLIAVLSAFGRTDVVGRSFGVIKLWLKGLGEIDFSLPRRESKSGAGHRGFIVAPDPAMSPEEACARRDFTLNAILLDPFDSEIFDYNDGIKDLKNKILRHTSHQFVEDPLRPLRAVQLAARFGFSMHADTASLCATMVEEARTLAKERVFGEWQKWAVQGTRPSAGLRILAESGWGAVFPELAPGLNDRAGSLETRVDRARRIADRDMLDPTDTTVLLVAALCRDMDLAAGAAFAARIGLPPKIHKRVTLLCTEARGLEPNRGFGEASTLRVAERLAPETVAMLCRLLEAEDSLEAVAARLLRIAAALGVDRGPPSPLILGRDLAALGVPPGPTMGALLKAAFEAQLSGAFNTKEDAVRWITARISDAK